MVDGILRENRASFTMIAIMWVVAIVAMALMPDSIPVHWGFDSTEPNRWGSKFELVIMPILFTLTCLICMGIGRATRGDTYGDGKLTEVFMHKCTTALTVFFLVLEIALLILIVVNL